MAAALFAALLVAPTPAPAAPRTHTIVMQKMKFIGVPATVRAGDTILWVNKDMVRHTATAKDRSFNIDLAAGKAGRTVIRKAGTIPFLCTYHPAMKGVLKVAGR